MERPGAEHATAESRGEQRPETTPAPFPVLAGRAKLRRVSRWRFPSYQLEKDDQVIALLGPLTWMRLYLGSGVRILLPDGTRWRLRSIERASAICPVVIDTTRRKLAIAAPGGKNYGITGRTFGYTLNPETTPRFGRANEWTLREHENQLAVFTRRPLQVSASSPIPVPAAVLGLALMKYSIPGEKELRLPAFKWGRR